MAIPLSKARPSQAQLFYLSHRKVADTCHAFHDAVKEGLTREELQALIKRRPDVWGRFSSWLDKLPSQSYSLWT